MPTRITEQIAVVFALCAFSVCIAAGIVTDIEAKTLLVRSLVVLIGSYAIGGVLGRVARVTLNEHLTTLRAVRPIPAPIQVEAPAPSSDVDIVDEVQEK